MRKGKFSTIFERNAVVEELARKLASVQGWEPNAERSPNFMRDSPHPRARQFYQMALIAVGLLVAED